MGAPKPTSTKSPFQNESSSTQTNTYGYMSQDPSNSWVKAYTDVPIDVDPGVGRRSDLAEQEMENRWNSGFASGIPAHVRMMNVDAAKRALRSEAAAQAQQAEYAKNALALNRAGSLLPQMVQTGGTQTGQQSGYQTQVMPGQPGFMSSFLGGLGGALGGFI